VEKLYTIKEVAEYLHVHENSVRRWIAKSQIESVRVGGLVRIAESQLNAFLVERNVK